MNWNPAITWNKHTIYNKIVYKLKKCKPIKIYLKIIELTWFNLDFIVVSRFHQFGVCMTNVFRAKYDKIETVWLCEEVASY